MDPGERPIPVGHYLIQPPAGKDWFSITPPELPPQVAPDYPAVWPSSCPGAYLLFIRKPTSYKPVVTRGLYRSFETNPKPRQGRTEPAAVVRIAPLDTAVGNLEAQLAALTESNRVAPNAANREAFDPAGGTRHERSFTELAGLSCVRDEFVFLQQANSKPGSKVSRVFAHSVACADPACPGQAIALVVRATGNETEAVEREAAAFLGGLRVDGTVPPDCNPPRASTRAPVKRPGGK